MALLWEEMKKKNNTASFSYPAFHNAVGIATRTGRLQGIGA